MPPWKLGLKCVVCSVFALTVVLARAQDSVSEIVSLPASHETWSAEHVLRDQNVLVVSAKEPKVRQKCRVESISEKELRCARKPARKPVVFAKDDVVALISPAEHSRSGWSALGFSVFASGGGAVIYAAVLVASVAAPYILAAIPIAIVGGLLAADSLMFLCDEEGSRPEEVLYLQHGQQLQFKLRS